MTTPEKQTDGWFKDGLELIPLGVRIDAVAAFLGGLMRQGGVSDYSEHKAGADSMLIRLDEANLSGFGYEHGED